jgi:hypothetical protein
MEMLLKGSDIENHAVAIVERAFKLLLVRSADASKRRQAHKARCHLEGCFTRARRHP